MSTAAKISIQIDAQTALLQKGFAEARGQMQSFARGMSGSVAWGMTKFTVGLHAVRGGFAAARGALSSFSRTIDQMGAMDEMSTRLGMSADALTVLGYAAEQTGSTQEYMNTALEKMQNNLADAAAGGGAASKAFAELGLSAQGLVGLSADKVFTRIAARMQQVKLATDRTRLSIDIFGKAGGQLLNLLNMGSKGIAEYAQEAQKMGLMMGNARAGVEEVGDSINKLYRTMDAVKQRSAVWIAPLVGGTAEFLSQMATGIAIINGTYEAGSSKTDFRIVGSSKKAAREAMDLMKKSVTPTNIAPVTRGSAAGFSAIQEAQRKDRQDAGLRHKEMINLLGKIYARQKDSALILSPVDIT
jgi:hypothetical protein